MWFLHYVNHWNNAKIKEGVEYRYMLKQEQTHKQIDALFKCYGDRKDNLRIIIAGTRTYNDYSALCDAVDGIISEFLMSCPGCKVTIISGHASGADVMGERYAHENGYDLKVFPAEWKLYGKMAGPVRNRQMLNYAKEGFPLVIAFWDGRSRGTKNMIEISKDSNVAVYVYEIGAER